MRAQIAWLKQKLFGPGKSETLDRAQLLLQIGELEKLAAAERPTETITYERPTGAEAHAAGRILRAPAGEGDRRDYPRGGARRSGPLRKDRRRAHLRDRPCPAAALQARDRAAEVPAPLGSQPSTALGAGAKADRNRRLRLGRADRLGADREVLRSSATLSAGKDARPLGRADLAAELERLGRRGHRAARTAGQADETEPAGRRLRAGRRDADPLQRSRSA